MRFLALLFLLLTAPALVFAGQSSDMPASSAIEKLPHFETLTDEKFEEQTELLQIAPDCEKTARYSVRMPKDWKRVPRKRFCDKKSEDVGADFALYLGPIRFGIPLHQSSSFEIVELKNLDYNISARSFFLNEIAHKNYKILGIDEISDFRVEALYSREIKKSEENQIVREIVQKNGSHFIVIEYFLPQNDWEEEKALQDNVIRSFRVLNPAKPPSPVDCTKVNAIAIAKSDPEIKKFCARRKHGCAYKAGDGKMEWMVLVEPVVDFKAGELIAMGDHIFAVVARDCTVSRILYGR